MANRPFDNSYSNDGSKQQYWRNGAPPRPQDASTAKERYWHGPGPDPAANTQQTWAGTQQQTAYASNQNIPHPPGAQGYVAAKDHVAAGLLGIFLGSLGVHKFYLGYTKPAFIMLGVTILGSLFTLGLAGGVMSIIGFIEGIIYLVKNQEQFTQEYVYSHKEWF